MVGVELAQAWSSLGASVSSGRGARPRARGRGAVRERGGRPRGSRRRGRGADRGRGRRRPRAARAGRSRCGSTSGDELRGDELLVAVGRRPRTDELGLETAGVEARRLPRGRRPAAGRGLGVAVRDRRRQRALAAHPHGQVPGADLRRPHPRQGRERRRADKAGSPRVVFTEPQVAAVGLTLAAARASAICRREPSTSRPSANAGASFVGRNAPGTSRLVIDEDRRMIVGATFVGPRDRRVAARGDDRRRRRGPARATRPRGAGVPDPQRGLAVPARGVRALVGGGCSWTHVSGGEVDHPSSRGPAGPASVVAATSAGGRGARVRPRAGCRGRGSRGGGRAAACRGRAPARPSPAGP